MQVCNGDAWVAKAPLQELLKEPWPVKAAYSLARLGRRLNEQIAIIDEVRNRLINQYGEKGEKGQVTISAESPNWPQFIAAYNELMDEPVDIALDKIVLPDVEGLSVLPQTLMSLDAFVEVA